MASRPKPQVAALVGQALGELEILASLAELFPELTEVDPRFPDISEGHKHLEMPELIQLVATGELKGTAVSVVFYLAGWRAAARELAKGTPGR